MVDVCGGGGRECLMHDIDVRDTLLAVNDPEFLIRVPAAVTDPLTAIIVQPVHAVGIMGESIFLLFPYTPTELFAEELVRVQEQDIIMSGEGCAGILLRSVTGKSPLMQLPPQFPHDDCRPVRTKRIQHDALVR